MSIPDERSPIIVEDDALRDGFTQIPNVILRHPTISPGAKLAYATLLMYAWQSGSCFPGQETMATDMGVTDRSVRTYLSQLEAAALITIRQRGLGRTNLYVIHRIRAENIAGQSGGAEDISGQERNAASGQERKILPTKNTQGESDAIEQTQITPLPPEMRFADQLAAFTTDQRARLARAGITDYASWCAVLHLPLAGSPEQTWTRALNHLKKQRGIVG